MITHPFLCTFRKADKKDLPAILNLILDDELARQREDLSQLEKYQLAFDHIDQDDNQLLVVGENHQKEILATCQLSLIPNLTYQGRPRLQIEAVRVNQQYRGQKIGSQLMQFAIDFAKKNACCMVQLTMDKKRGDTLEFYQQLGFTASHEGFKLFL